MMKRPSFTPGHHVSGTSTAPRTPLVFPPLLPTVAESDGDGSPMGITTSPNFERSCDADMGPTQRLRGIQSAPSHVHTTPVHRPARETCLRDASHNNDEESGSILNHADSFYASLMTAQQVRRQRDITITTATHAGSAAPSSAYTSQSGGTQQSESANVGPLSARSRPSRAASAAMGTSPSSLDTSQPPRTLQDFLSWRQDMLEARMKEHAQQQQLRQDSMEFSMSRGSRSPSLASEGLLRQSRSTLLAPQLFSPPCLSLSSRQPSSQFSCAQSLVVPKENTLTPDELLPGGVTPPAVTMGAETPLPLSLKVAPRAVVPLTQQQQQQQPWAPQGMVAQRYPSRQSTTASSAMPSRTTPHVLEREKSARAEELFDYIRLHDQDIGEGLLGRFALLLLLLVALMFVVDSPFLPGGSWGTLY